ncbi:PLP-dependent aminotransferase family protein [Ralstonia solanacearum]|nr:PLP-dependent aminotransferase family protein [Ralstonia solanacearum]NKA93140.1 PLP-dependent aminotransferase family protein [Ralstonia solanacearum]
MGMPSALDKLGFQPDPNAAQPLYVQLTAALSDAIRTGRITIGSKLPSERLYAEHLGVSRTTVTAAYQELKAAGLVQGYVGRGAIVVTDNPDRSITDAIDWSRLGRIAQPRSVAIGSGLISFGDGWLHPSLTPHTALAACAAGIAEDTGVLSNATPMLGSLALREALGDILRANGVNTTPDEVLITGGAQQGLNVIARAMLSPGDTVVCESPTWHGAFRAFQAAGAHVVSVAMDREGIDPDALEGALGRLRPKFVYLIPSFHCPTGRLTSLERRRRILAICNRFGTPIVESNVYGDVSFGDPLPSLKALDAAGIVIHQGSASKTISAALRLGWLVVPRAAVPFLAQAKASQDLSTPTLTQAVLTRFLKSGAYARHLPQFRAALRARRDALVEALATCCPELSYATPQGGLYLWARLPDGIQGHQIEVAAANGGVSVRGGEAFLPNGGTSGHIRLCYAAPALADIRTGIERLGTALRIVLQEQSDPAAGDSALASV